MQNQTKCTFVILIDTYDGLINLSTNFKTGILNKSSVQTVIVNRADMTDIESENAKRYANKKGYDYLQMPSDTTIPQCYNNAISLIKGQYVCFTNQYCIYDDLSVIAINKSIKNHPDANLVSLNYKKKNPDLDIHIKRYNFSMRYVDINKMSTWVN